MRRLLLTCTDLMAIQFLVPHVKYLSRHGFSVELACSEVGGRMDDLRSRLDGIAAIHPVRLVRSPFSASNRYGYRDLKAIIDGGHWDVIWTNEPVMGVMTRLAAREARSQGTKVVYMVHGFHFYTGAPLKNWLLYYPVEKYCSCLCDMIVTINNEDYQRAKTFHAARVEKIPGVGVNTKEFATCPVDRVQKRKELGIPDDAFFVVSVGELKEHKNHSIMLRAVAEVNDPAIYYGICGKGELLEPLRKLAEDLNISGQTKFFGYRKDIPEVLRAADLFAFPSKRDGLGLAALEAMASGLPLLTSDIRGISDYVIDDVTGYRYGVADAAGFAEGLRRYVNNPQLRHRIGEKNRAVVVDYDIGKICEAVYGLMNTGD